MTKQNILVAMLFLAGCGDRVSLGEHGTDRDQLTVRESEQGDPSDGDTDTNGGGGTSHGRATDGETISWTDIEYIEVDELGSARVRKIRVDADCHVTDDTGLDAVGDASKCTEVMKLSLDTSADYGCGYSCAPAASCQGTVQIHLKDGRDLVRNIADDNCSVQLPSIATHKVVYWVWYSVGGG